MVDRGHALGRRVKTWVKQKLGFGKKSKRVEVAETTSESDKRPLLCSEQGELAVAVPVVEESVADEEVVATVQSVASASSSVDSFDSFESDESSLFETLVDEAPLVKEPVKALGIWHDVSVEFSAVGPRPAEPTPYPFSMDGLVAPEKKAVIPMPTHGKVHCSYLDEEFTPMPTIREESEDEVEVEDEDLVY